MLAVFVLVMFLAVFVRRFGVPFFFYGFMAWMGYFFASFLQTTLSALPGLMVAVVAATVWLVLLSVTVLRTHPRRVLRSTWRPIWPRSGRRPRLCRAARDPSRRPASPRTVATPAHRAAGRTRGGRADDGGLVGGARRPRAGLVRRRCAAACWRSSTPSTGSPPPPPRWPRSVPR